MIALFFGTRPQVIKASVLRDALTAVSPLVAIDTGQHYDYSLHKVHYEQLSVAPPDVYLGVGSGSHAEQTAERPPAPVVVPLKARLVEREVVARSRPHDDAR